MADPTIVEAVNQMTLVQQAAGGMTVLGGIAGAVYAANRYLKGDRRDDKRDDRTEAVNDKVHTSLTRVIDALHAELARTQAELVRTQADTQRIAQGMTQMTAQMITQSNNMLVLKQDADRFCNLLVTVKRQQDEMLKKGTLKDRLVDLNTDILRYDHLK